MLGLPCNVISQWAGSTHHMGLGVLVFTPIGVVPLQFGVIGNVINRRGVCYTM